MPGPALVALDIPGPEKPWWVLGLAVAVGVIQVGDVTLRLVGEGEGITAWALRGAGGPESLDGLTTRWLPEPVSPTHPFDHALGATTLDHVVIATPDPRRTFAAFADAGLVLRHEAETGPRERPLRQGFFRHGQAIVEVVGPLEPDGDGPARFWGMAFAVGDLDAARERLGEHAGDVRDAVQPGRRILSVRPSAGLPVPVALMTPAPDRPPAN